MPSRKLIEVALPLDAINKASAREKSIRHGHPSTLHLWWARRPLAAARAVIFAQMVDDPSAHPERFPTEEAQEQERQRLFRLIEELVKWENTTNEDVLNRTLIDRTTNQSISDRVPSDNMAQLRSTPGFPVERALAFHCLSLGASSPLLQHDYDASLAQREERLWEEIRRVTGATEAADLKAEG